MNGSASIVLYRFRYLFGILLIVISLFLLSLVLSLIGSSQAQAKASQPDTAQVGTYSSDNPNIITDGFDSALNSISGATTSILSAGQSINNRLIALSNSVVTATFSGSKYVMHGAVSGVLFAAHGVGKSASFAVHTPLYAWQGVSQITHIGAFIKPAAEEKAQAPKIDPVIAAEIAASQHIISAAPITTAADTSPQWPIHGYITEEFGVPHWPWQPTHTGIDISDGTAPGTTPVHPFKPGRVIAVIHSSTGFGNHVIIDHGGGLTSLYGHFYSTAVQVGQIVDKSTILGYEGTTGESTGVHVHFELDLNGVPVNPHLYVPGQP